MPNISGIWKSGAIFKRDAKIALSYETQFIVQWVATVAQVVITYLIGTLIPPSPKFGIGGHVSTFFAYAIVNSAFFTLQTTALTSFGRTVRDGQTQGTLEALLATPTSLPVIVLSGGLWAFAYTTLTSITMLVLASFLGLDLRHTNVPLLLFFLVLTVLALSPLGVASAAVTMVVKQSAPFEFALNTLSYIFGGVYLPVASLPHALQWIGWLLPITHALTGFRTAIAGGSLRDVAGDAVWLVCATAILVPSALFAFDRAVARAKSDGTLGGY